MQLAKFDVSSVMAKSEGLVKSFAVAVYQVSSGKGLTLARLLGSLDLIHTANHGQVRVHTLSDYV